jgi:hypothetical protein
MYLIIRYLLAILVVTGVVFPSISYGGDYLYLDKRGKYSPLLTSFPCLRSLPLGKATNGRNRQLS